MTYVVRHQTIDKDTGQSAIVTPFRQMVHVSSIRLLGSSFSGTTLDSELWTSSATGTGAVAHPGNEADLTTGATANSSIQLTTTRTARGMSGTVQWIRCVIQLGDTGTTNNVRRWGAFDDNNGVFFQLSGTTLSVVTRKATSDTAVASGSWNGTAFTLNTNVNSYDIIFTASTVYFYVNSVLVHTASFPTATWSLSRTLPMRLQNTNSGGSTSNVSLKCRAITVERFGEEHSRPMYKNIAGNATTICKRGSGTLHRLILNAPNTTGTITMYDNTTASGTLIATLDMAKSSSIVDLDYNVDFNNGLTVVTASTPGDITVIWD